MGSSINNLTNGPVGIRVREYPRYLLLVVKCDKRWWGPPDENVKTEASCHSRCGTVKITLCAKDEGAAQCLRCLHFAAPYWLWWHLQLSEVFSSRTFTKGKNTRITHCQRIMITVPTQIRTYFVVHRLSCLDAIVSR